MNFVEDIDAEKEITRQSFFKINGIPFSHSKSEMQKLIYSLYQRLASILSRDGIELQFIYSFERPTASGCEDKFLSEFTPKDYLEDGFNDKYVNDASRFSGRVIEDNLYIKIATKKTSDIHHKSVVENLELALNEMFVLHHIDAELYSLITYGKVQCAASTGFGDNPFASIDDLVSCNGGLDPFSIKFEINSGVNIFSEFSGLNLFVRSICSNIFRSNYYLNYYREFVEKYSHEVCLLIKSSIYGSPKKIKVIDNMLGMHFCTKNTHAIGLNKIFDVLPLNASKSPFYKGSILFETLDNRVFPYEPILSSKYNTSNEIVYDIYDLYSDDYHFEINSAIIRADVSGKIPKISRIKIGCEEDRFISNTKKFLTGKYKDSAKQIFISDFSDFGLNIFDTILGVDFPLEWRRDSTINIIKLICSDKDNHEIEDLSTGAIYFNAISDLVDSAFNYFSYRSCGGINAKKYTKGLNHDVDDAVLSVFDSNTPETWWDVVNELYSSGFVDEAESAQKYAVPVLSDLIQIAESADFRAKYSYIIPLTRITGESLADLLVRKITEFVRSEPCMSLPTSSNISINEITTLSIIPNNKNMQENGKSIAILYMMARHIVAPNRYDKYHIINDIPLRYRSRLESYFNEIKHAKLVYSNYDVVANHKSVSDQVNSDMRQGRKCAINVSVDTKSTDLDRHFFDYFGSVVILGSDKLSDHDVDFFKQSETINEDWEKPSPRKGYISLALNGGVNSSSIRVRQDLYLAINKKHNDLV